MPHLAVTVTVFVPVALHACDALVEVDHGDDAPSPQLKLYSTACPQLHVEPVVVYASLTFTTGLVLPDGVPGAETASAGNTFTCNPADVDETFV